MSDNEALRSRIDALELFILKHLSRLYSRVEPSEVPTLIDQMRGIYTHPASPKVGEKPPVPKVRADLEPMISIYKRK
jgi:hypothetical protein